MENIATTREPQVAAAPECDLQLLASSLASMRRTGDSCDVHLQAVPAGWRPGDVESPLVSAHSVILKALSPYIRQQLQDREGGTSVVLRIEDVEAPALEVVVSNIYEPGSLRLSGENVEAVLQCATRLQMEPLRGKCCTYLEAALAPDTVLRVRAVAERNGCHALVGAASAYLHGHFGEVARTQMFAALEADALAALLQSDLQVYDQTVVLDAVLRWVRREPAARGQRLVDLLPLVRLTAVPPNELSFRTNHEPLSSASADVKCYLLRRVMAHLMRHARAGATNCPCTRRGAPRPPRTASAPPSRRHSRP